MKKDVVLMREERQHFLSRNTEEVFLKPYVKLIDSL